MRYHRSWFLTAPLLFSTALLGATDISANASRDATRLIVCMKAFDAACVNALSYTKMLEERGMSRDQLDQGVANLYRQLKSIHARYSLLQLAAPWPPFALRGRTYVFIPYSMALSARGQDVTAKSFFIGVSEDSGNSWTFVEGQNVTQDNIAMIIPDFGGGALPSTSLSRAPAQ